MAFTSSTRLVNPRLGTYFAIFAAAFASLVLMGLMLEQLGVSDVLLRLAMFAGPFLLYATIGVGSRASDAHDYFVCGRRVPAFFNGLVLGIAALGGCGFLAFTGALFIVGFDALCLGIGWCAGLVFMAVLFAPYVRKFGAYTLPSFLGRRFESRGVRVVAAGVLLVPMLLLLAAEGRFAGYAAGWLLGQSDHTMAAIVIALTTAILIIGGMRSVTWSGVAKAIAALLALAVPVTIMAIILSNVPFPQMTHGNTLRVLSRMEIVRGAPIVLAPPISMDLPDDGIELLVKRFIQSFGSVGSLGFVLTSLIMAAGIASSPHLLARSGTTPGVYEARKSLGWAVLVVGIVCLTLPAVAVYLRYLVFDQVVGQPVERLPGWFQALQQAGIARIESRTTTVSMGRLGFERDAILFALPVAAGFPQVLTYLALAGAFAATLCALSASLFTAASILAEDMTRADTTGIATDRARLGKARIALIGVGGLAIALAVASPADPLQLFLWMVTLCASAAFPVLFLSIWWRRASAWGAMVGMLAGFAAAAVTILLAEAGALAIPSSLAGAIGIPCGLLATIMASLAVKTSDSRLLEHVHEMRVPGGETIHDREVRLLRLKSRTPA